MARLLRDRYLVDARSAWDLVTGELIPVDSIPGEAMSDASAASPSLEAVLEVRDHGRDGAPRSMHTSLASSVRWPQAIRRLADDAATRGYVAIAVDLYFRLAPTLADDLRDRTLLLIAHAETRAEEAQAALIDAAARSPRPHLLVTIETRRSRPISAVREARAAYGARASTARAVTASAEDVAPVRRASRATEFVAAGRHAAAERLLRDVASAL